jgi:hypothetical protein
MCPIVFGGRLLRVGAPADQAERAAEALDVQREGAEPRRRARPGERATSSSAGPRPRTWAPPSAPSLKMSCDHVDREADDDGPEEERKQDMAQGGPADRLVADVSVGDLERQADREARYAKSK